MTHPFDTMPIADDSDMALGEVHALISIMAERGDGMSHDEVKKLDDALHARFRRIYGMSREAALKRFGN